MVHLAIADQMISAAETARVYWNNLGDLNGIPCSVLRDRSPKFVSKFWQELWRLIGTELRMCSVNHSQTDGQTGVGNRVVEMFLRCTLHNSKETAHWAWDLSVTTTHRNPRRHTSLLLAYNYRSATHVDLIRDYQSKAILGVNVFIQRIEGAAYRASQMPQRP